MKNYSISNQTDWLYVADPTVAKNNGLIIDGCLVDKLDIENALNELSKSSEQELDKEALKRIREACEPLVEAVPLAYKSIASEQFEYQQAVNTNALMLFKSFNEFEKLINSNLQSAKKVLVASKKLKSSESEKIGKEVEKLKLFNDLNNELRALYFNTERSIQSNAFSTVSNGWGKEHLTKFEKLVKGKKCPNQLLNLTSIPKYKHVGFDQSKKIISQWHQEKIKTGSKWENKDEAFFKKHQIAVSKKQSKALFNEDFYQKLTRQLESREYLEFVAQYLPEHKSSMSVGKLSDALHEMVANFIDALSQHHGYTGGLTKNNNFIFYYKQWKSLSESYESKNPSVYLDPSGVNKWLAQHDKAFSEGLDKWLESQNDKQEELEKKYNELGEVLDSICKVIEGERAESINIFLQLIKSIKGIEPKRVYRELLAKCKKNVDEKISFTQCQALNAADPLTGVQIKIPMIRALKLESSTTAKSLESADYEQVKKQLLLFKNIYALYSQAKGSKGFKCLDEMAESVVDKKTKKLRKEQRLEALNAYEEKSLQNSFKEQMMHVQAFVIAGATGFTTTQSNENILSEAKIFGSLSKAQQRLKNLGSGVIMRVSLNILSCEDQLNPTGFAGELTSQLQMDQLSALILENMQSQQGDPGTEELGAEEKLIENTKKKGPMSL